MYICAGVGDIDEAGRSGITSIGLQMEPYDSITNMLAAKQGPFVTLTIFGHAEVLRRGPSSISKSSRDAVDLKKMLLKDFNDLCLILRRSLSSHSCLSSKPVAEAQIRYVKDWSHMDASGESYAFSFAH